MNMFKYGFACLCMVVFANAESIDADVLTDDEEGFVEVDLSDYLKDGDVLYKTLWKPKDCAGPIGLGDDVTMTIEYDGQKNEGKEEEMKKAVTIKIGETIKGEVEGLTGLCLGEQRRLVIPQEVLRSKYKQLLPGILDRENTYIEVEVTMINQMSWHKLESGLHLAMLEPVDSAFCSRTVVNGDTLSVEYEGTLEDGKVFDSSAARGAPFGPFVHGKKQIIEGYTETLEGRCLGERWRMTVPPHLAYGEDGVGEDIPGGATLTFDVRLVQLNDDIWSEEVKGRKAFSWKSISKPKSCKEISGVVDEIYIHYDATREDKSKFGSLVDNNPPYGPFSLSGKGTFVPALDLGLPGMCLGERRMVVVPPRLGWVGGHHDSIMVEVVLVKMNGKEAEGFNLGRKRERGERGTIEL